MHAARHAYIQRDIDAHRHMQTETYLEIHTETEVHRESETKRHRYIHIYIHRDTDRERSIEAQLDTEMAERDWQSQAGTERYIEKERKTERDVYIEV